MYVSYLRKLFTMWMLVLPWGLVGSDIGWIALLIVGLNVITFGGLERVIWMMENPFGEDVTDLDLVYDARLCLLAMLGHLSLDDLRLWESCFEGLMDHDSIKSFYMQYHHQRMYYKGKLEQLNTDEEQLALERNLSFRAFRLPFTSESTASLGEKRMKLESEAEEQVEIKEDTPRE